MEKQVEWVILELMGHRVLAGRLSEVERAGTKLLRIEVPLGPPPADGTPEKFFVQDYGGSALYCVTPVPEEVAREKARLYRPANATVLLGAGAQLAPPQTEMSWEGEEEEPAPSSPPRPIPCEAFGRSPTPNPSPENIAQSVTREESTPPGLRAVPPPVEDDLPF